jgi:hypothetical protein
MGLSHSLCSANNSIHLVNIQSSTCNDQQGRTKVHGDDGQLVLRLLDQLLQLAAVDLALNDVLLHSQPMRQHCTTRMLCSSLGSLRPRWSPRR